MKTLTTILAATALVAGLSADAGAQVPDWNRRVDGIAVLPSPAGGQEVHAVWTVELGQTAQTTTVLSTEAVLFINGVETIRDVVDVVAFAGAGGCGSCAPGCGDGAVNGQAAALLCLSEGQAGCSCQFPPYTSTFPVPLQPGDELMILLRPAPGALPELDTEDDLLEQAFDGAPVMWDRRILGAFLSPTPGAPPGTWDLTVDFDTGITALGFQVEITPGFDVLANGVVVASFEPPCGPWIAAPGVGCIQAECPGGGCGTITCNGHTPVPMTCQLAENDVGLQFCGCFMVEACSEVIPGLTIDPFEDEIEVVLKPVPGALPELPGFDQDREVPEIDLGNWKDLGHSLRGTYEPVLEGTGTLLGGDLITLSLSDALESSSAWLVVGLVALEAPFKGGVMVPDPSPPGLTLALPTDAAGTAQLVAPVPFGLPSGFELLFQWWIKDPLGPQGFAASNAVQGTTP